VRNGQRLKDMVERMVEETLRENELARREGATRTSTP